MSLYLAVLKSLLECSILVLGVTSGAGVFWGCCHVCWLSIVPCRFGEQLHAELWCSCPARQGSTETQCHPSQLCRYVLSCSPGPWPLEERQQKFPELQDAQLKLHKARFKVACVSTHTHLLFHSLSSRAGKCLAALQCHILFVGQYSSSGGLIYTQWRQVSIVIYFP